LDQSRRCPVKAFLATDGEPGNEWASALADEIERRGLDL
jgi:hypothetical protein